MIIKFDFNKALMRHIVAFLGLLLTSMQLGAQTWTGEFFFTTTTPGDSIWTALDFNSFGPSIYQNNTDVTFSGLNQGSVFIDTDSGSSPVVPGSITVLAGDYVFESDDVSGSGTLSVSGGSLTLQQANTFTGATAVSGGTLILDSGSALADTNAVTVTSPGILQVLIDETIGSLSGSGTVENGGSGTVTLTVGDSGTDSTFEGTLQDGTGSGTLGLTKTGAGMLTLSEANTYTGATTVSSGTLILNGGLALADTNAVTVTSPGILQVLVNETIGSLSGLGTVENGGSGTVRLTVGDSDTDSTFEGTLQDGTGGGTLGLTKTGAGMLTVSGANTYTGVTTVSGGTLMLESALTNTTEVTVDEGAILKLGINGSSIGPSSGAVTITNAGTITSDSDGLSLVGSGNIVNNGGSIAGTIGIDFSAASGTNTFINDSDAFVSGTSGLAISGGAVTGLQVVNESDALIDGSIEMQGILDQSGVVAGDVTNNGSSGVVYGVGSIDGSLTIEGATLSPGSEGGVTGLSSQGSGVIGTLTVEDSFILDTDATFIVDLTDVSGTSDRVSAGSRTIEGDAQLELLTADDLSGGQNVYVIIDADRNPSGDFTVDPSFDPSLVNPYIWQDAEKVAVVALPETFETFATNSIQTEVAQLVDSAIDALPNRMTIADSMMGRFATAVNFSADPAKALEQLFSQAYSGYLNTNFMMSKSVSSAVLLHLHGLRYRQFELENKLKFWVNEVYTTTSYDSSSNGGSDYDYDNHATIIGGDYTFSPQFVVGAAFAVSTTDIDWDDINGKGTTDAYHLIGYLSYENSNFYFDANLTYASSDHDVARRVAVTDMLSTDPLLSQFAFNELLRSDASGYSLGTSACFGMQFHTMMGFLIDPQLRMDYVIGELDGFTETSSSGDSFWMIQDTDAQFFDTSVQVNLSRPFGIVEKVALMPEVALGWIHSFDVSNGDTVAQFTGGTQKFRIPGESGISGDSFLMSIGGRALFNLNEVSTEISLHYNGNSGDQGDAHNVFGKVSFGF